MNEENNISEINELKTEAIVFAVSPSEKALIETESKKNDRSVSNFCRWVIFTYINKTKEE